MRNEMQLLIGSWHFVSRGRYYRKSCKAYFREV